MSRSWPFHVAGAGPGGLRCEDGDVAVVIKLDTLLIGWRVELGSCCSYALGVVESELSKAWC